MRLRNIHIQYTTHTHTKIKPYIRKGRDMIGFHNNLLRNLVTDRVNSSGMVSNCSGEGREEEPGIAKPNIPQEDDKWLTLFVIYVT